MRRLLVLTIFLVISGVPAMAQSTCSSSGTPNTLYCVPILAVEDLHTSTQTAVPTVPPAFSGLNAAIGIQLSEVPTPSPAAGITFAFGPNGLIRQRELGPIFSEAPPTVGRHKLYLAFTYQYLQFDQIDAVPLKQIPLQISGCDPTNASCVSPFVETSSRLDLKVHQFTTYATFGLFSRLDVSVAIPVLDVRMGMQTVCSVCSQTQPNGSVLIFTPNLTTARASGIGDVTVRVKATALKGARAGLAIGADVRAPTGKELNFLGAGAVGVRPFAAFGFRAPISPHADIAYRANGRSVLAATGQNGNARLPNSLDYSAGIDFGFLRPVSITGDFLVQTFFSANRVILGSRQGLGLNNPDISCNIAGAAACQGQTFTTKSFALGGKENVFGNLLITANVLFKLDHYGLHFKPAPMIGVSYTF